MRMLPPLEEIEVERINKRKSTAKQKKTVEVDMNPMVDLAFLLLTFFMLATTFSKPQAMELLVPAKAKEESVEKEMPVKESKTLSIVLLNKKIVWYNGITEPETKEMDYDQAQLEELIMAQQASIDGLVVLIKADSLSSYGHLVDVLDVMNHMKVKRYALAPMSDFDLELNKE